MSAALQKLRAATRRLAVIAFGLWLAGAGCAFCCADADAAVLADAAPVISDGGDAGAPAHHDRAASAPTSCHAHAGPSKAARAGGHARAVSPPHSARDHAGSCCTKTRQAADPARKLRPLPAPAAHTAAREFFNHASHTPDAAPPELRGRLPDDGHDAHVRFCVFLI